jgi:HlyD family secretion protein
LAARKTKRTILIVLGAIVLLLVVMGVAFRPRDRGPAVQVAVVEQGGLEQRASGSGTLEGLTRVEISAATMGLIDTISVQEGDTVSRGDLLLRLETREAQASLDEASAAEYSASVAWTQASRLRDRMNTLFEAGLASEEEVLSAREASQTAWAAVLRARASAAMADDALSKTEYTSPIDGIVTALNVEQGEMAVTGTMNNPGTVLLTIEDMSRMLVRVSMVESEVVDVRSGMPAEVTLDALPDTVFEGVVTAVGLAATRSSIGADVAEYEVLVELQNPDERVRSGMSAAVEIITAKSDSCLTAPIQCVVPRPDPADSTKEIDAVLRISGGRIQTVPVTTGVVGVMDIEISGVSAGDSLVSGPLESLRDLRDDAAVSVEGAQGRGGRGQFRPGD